MFTSQDNHETYMLGLFVCDSPMSAILRITKKGFIFTNVTAPTVEKVLQYFILFSYENQTAVVVIA